MEYRKTSKKNNLDQQLAYANRDCNKLLPYGRNVRIYMSIRYYFEFDDQRPAIKVHQPKQVKSEDQIQKQRQNLEARITTMTFIVYNNRRMAEIELLRDLKLSKIWLKTKQEKIKTKLEKT